MHEFELISRYFDRKGDVAGVAVGIGDDGAVLVPTVGKEQIQVVDTLVAGVHFPSSTDPADIAYRAVAVNLSDIAAMGGTPRWMTLALTLDDWSERWVEAFAAGLFCAADKYDVVLIGGDTTGGPVATVTVTVVGEVEPGTALLRSGAKPGDTLFVTGTLGDSAAGLSLLQAGETDDFLVNRFLRPTPRLEIGKALVGNAHAAIDISDGLLGDLKKLLAASGVGGEVDLDKLPLSSALRTKFSSEDQRRLALTGGDDYELCFAAPESSVENIVGITAIGRVSESPDLVCRSHGVVVEVEHSGYRHSQ